MVERLYAWFGGKALDRGASPRIEDRVALFAIETGDAPAEPAVVSEDGAFTLPLRRVGKTQAGALFAAAATLPEGFAMRWLWRDEPK